MRVQRVTTWLVGHMPRRAWLALRGDGSSPSTLASIVHKLFNRLPGERYPVLPCAGPLTGYRMRVDWNRNRSFVYGTWEPEVVDALRRSVTPGMIALDLGAHTGFYTLLLSKLVGPNGKVVAFEPFPPNFQILEENVHLNGLDNVILRREAVAGRSGDVRLESPNHEPSLIAKSVRPGEGVEALTVPAVSLDDWGSESGSPIHFVKMDVEGAEADVLQGARRVLELHRPRMVIELHATDTVRDDHPALALLIELGYRVTWIDAPGITAHIFAQPAETPAAP